ncbi:unnamed protein product [Owenia fusiformis]|uniref:ATP synthase-coupling factor 6, mitochondrial n=1 Tax=Owenia fusiformis TaxID=6347 RepID=A0A8J1TWQ9_OWEFU|nr:unnamed protein product [Owenia fusiformis]
MLTRVLLKVSQAGQCVRTQFSRNLGVSAVVTQKAQANLDPIQQLFLEKVRDYSKQSKAAGGKLVGASPDVEKQLDEQLAKIDRVYNAKGQDMTKFPALNFQDLPLEPPGIEVSKESADAHVTPLVNLTSSESEADDPNKPYFEM